MKLIIAAGLLTAVFTSTAVIAKPSVSATLREQAQAACYDDAQKLCGNVFPDEDKVIACMKPKKAMVSPKCRAFYDKVQ